MTPHLMAQIRDSQGNLVTNFGLNPGCGPPRRPRRGHHPAHGRSGDLGTAGQVGSYPRTKWRPRPGRPRPVSKTSCDGVDDRLRPGLPAPGRHRRGAARPGLRRDRSQGGRPGDEGDDRAALALTGPLPPVSPAPHYTPPPRLAPQRQPLPRLRRHDNLDGRGRGHHHNDSADHRAGGDNDVATIDDRAHHCAAPAHDLMRPDTSPAPLRRTALRPG